MFTIHTKGLITPDSTPVKGRYNPARSLSDTSITDHVPHRRLPRKPAPPPRHSPEPLETEVDYRLNHPVDFVVHMVSQYLYQCLYPGLSIIAQEALRPPMLKTWQAANALTIFVMHLLGVLNFGLGLVICAIRVSVKFTAEVLPLIVYHLFTHLMELMQYFRGLKWSDAVQLCWKGLEDDIDFPSLDRKSTVGPRTDSTPSQCITSPHSPPSPCTRKRMCPPSPVSLRKSCDLALKGSRPAPLRTDMSRASENPPYAGLGHRAGELRRILSDCSEGQLDAAGRLVGGLQAQAHARAGWKR